MLLFKAHILTIILVNLIVRPDKGSIVLTETTEERILSKFYFAIYIVICMLYFGSASVDYSS